MTTPAAPLPLTTTSLPALDPRVIVPGYDRDQAQVGIVHFGVGAFHRAHQALYLDDILAAGTTDWGICGVGVLPHDRKIADVLHAQDDLYTLITVAPDDTTTVRVVGSHLLHLHAPDDPQAVLTMLSDPATRIVSLTITEGGYSIDDATGAFEPTDPQTLTDLQRLDLQRLDPNSDGPAADSSPGTLPGSVLGFVVAALAARRTAAAPAFSVMSCDNIEHNGRVARAAVTGFARRLDPDLADWIEEHVAFPSSMVDRITPATTPAVVAAAAAYGVADAWPVRSESFIQWVLEDTFSAGRPPLDGVGVQLVDDVTPYELMKLRLLNASHQVMSYLGILAGYRYVHDVCRDPDFTRFLLDYMHQEAIPTLDPVPGIDLDAYCAQLIARFSSDAIADTLARQTVDASDRIPKFVLPVLRAQLDRGGEIHRATLALAAWSLYLDPASTDKVPGARDSSAGETSSGEADAPPTPVDRRLATLTAAAAAERERPGSFLDQSGVFGVLAREPRLQSAFADARTQLLDSGSRVAVNACTRKDPS